MLLTQDKFYITYERKAALASFEDIRVVGPFVHKNSFGHNTLFNEMIRDVKTRDKFICRRFD